MNSYHSRYYVPKTNPKRNLIRKLVILSLYALSLYIILITLDMQRNNTNKLLNPVIRIEKYPTQTYKIISRVNKITTKQIEDINIKIEEYILAKWGYTEHAYIALATFKHENGIQLRNYNFDCSITNTNSDSHRSIDVGIAMVNTYYHPYTIEQLKDCYFNIDVAYKIYEDAGNSFSPWYSYQHGKYTMFLNHRFRGGDDI